MQGGEEAQAFAGVAGAGAAGAAGAAHQIHSEYSYQTESSEQGLRRLHHSVNLSLQEEFLLPPFTSNDSVVLYRSVVSAFTLRL